MNLTGYRREFIFYLKIDPTYDVLLISIKLSTVNFITKRWFHTKY
ncbi:hypothetical protein LEP1GSC074_2402 [Leptospira noguchii str. Hook]|nr:hypothetical protein LEP1GSC074_2402 [Leptospira noguchii str. Hook]